MLKIQLEQNGPQEIPAAMPPLSGAAEQQVSRKDQPASAALPGGNVQIPFSLHRLCGVPRSPGGQARSN